MRPFSTTPIELTPEEFARVYQAVASAYFLLCKKDLFQWAMEPAEPVPNHPEPGLVVTEVTMPAPTPIRRAAALAPDDPAQCWYVDEPRAGESPDGA